MPARPVAKLLWSIAVVAGAALRLHQLRDQVLVDDEWHALHALLDGGPLDVLLSFGASDHSIPLTLYDVLLERTIGLSELGMRLPSLAAGVAALVVIPLLVRDVIGERASTVLAWLLAVSPLHVFFSRYARPYEPAMLLAFVALVACWRWQSGGGRAWRAAYVVCAVLAPWLLLVVLPFVAAPLALAALDSSRSGKSRRTSQPRAALLSTALVVAAGWALCLLPPVLANAGALADKVARGRIEGATLRGASELLLGTTSAPLRVAAALAALAGAVALARRRPRFAAYAGAACAAQLAALLLVAPHGLRFPIVLARYAFVLSPLVLAAIALGLDGADRALAARLRLPPLAAVSTAALAAFVLAGPLRWIYAPPNDFTNHASYQADYDPGRYFESFRPREVSAFYDELARRPAGSVTIVEAPWHFVWHGLAYLQRRHRQHVVVGFVDPRTDDVRGGEVPRDRSGIALRNAVHVGDEAALRARGVDYVVFHHDAADEMRVPFPVAPLDVAPWLDAYRARWGAPVHADHLVTVFALR